MEPVVKLLSDLVRIPSMNPMGRSRSGPEYTEELLARYVVDYLQRRHVGAELREVMPHRHNVVARIDAGAEHTLMLEAHLDTVHADSMTVPPFGAQIVDGRLQGRGACDTKASLAAFMDTICSLAEEKKRLRYNVLFVATVDEEYQFSGAKAVIADGLHADFGICGEPTMLHIIHAHKGVVRWRMRTSGRAAHSAYPDRGENAIYAMGHLLRALEEYAGTLGERKSHPALGSPTLSVGVIEGGQAVNIVPDACWIEVDRRVLPGEKTDDVLADVRRAVAHVGGWTMDPPHLEAPGMEASEGLEEIRRLRRAIESVDGSSVVEAAHYATDAGIIASAGIPCIVFGPGDIADAHTATESVEIHELIQAGEILRSFLT
jgi:acetylornithine deacetylase/succinyl-diaminopimelate desuccinylase family protein